MNRIKPRPGMPQEVIDEILGQMNTRMESHIQHAIESAELLGPCAEGECTMPFLFQDFGDVEIVACIKLMARGNVAGFDQKPRQWHALLHHLVEELLNRKLTMEDVEFSFPSAKYSLVFWSARHLKEIVMLHYGIELSDLEAEKLLDVAEGEMIQAVVTAGNEVLREQTFDLIEKQFADRITAAHEAALKAKVDGE